MSEVHILSPAIDHQVVGGGCDLYRSRGAICDADLNHNCVGQLSSLSRNRETSAAELGLASRDNVSFGIFLGGHNLIPTGRSTRERRTA